MRVSVRDLKNHSSAYLRLAAAGEDIVITSRRRPVARLMPVDDGFNDGDTEAGAVSRLRAQPWVRAGRNRRLEGSEQPLSSRPGEPPLSRILLEDRE